MRHFDKCIVTAQALHRSDNYREQRITQTKLNGLLQIIASSILIWFWCK